MTAYRVYEIFHSIQGESTFAGLPFVFIRLAGCNLRCRWCDTAKCWESRAGNNMSADEIITRAKLYGLEYVCLTGGEPFFQENVIELISRLMVEFKVVTIETNGSYDISRVPNGANVIMDIKCPSSGMEQFNHSGNFSILRADDEVKFIIADLQDYSFAKKILAEHLFDFSGDVIFSPVWQLMDASLLANWILNDKISVRLQLQVHKLLHLR